MTNMLGIHGVYLIVSIGVTVWVARNLRQNGKVFVTDGKNENPNVVDALSHLLIVGFYLINFGLISLALKFGGTVPNLQAAVELLSTKVGGVMLGLGCMHFVILMVFAGMRKNHRDIFEPVEAGRNAGKIPNQIPARL